MNGNRLAIILVLALAAAGALTVGAVGQAAGPAAAPATAASPAPLTPEVTAAVTAALQDERRAEVIYGAVVESFGQVLPFLHTQEAEIRHAAALEAVFLRRGLTIPGQEAMPAPQFDSLLDACKSAVEDEKANAALYDHLLALDPPADVVAVAERNRAASLERHLPAYQRCVDGGGTYTPPGGSMGAGPGAGGCPRMGQMGQGKGMKGDGMRGDGAGCGCGKMGKGPGMKGQGPGMKDGGTEQRGPGAGQGAGCPACANCPNRTDDGS
ncbi:MAG: hypothetical protein KDD11_13035 [Acidobacteria bacterium]|nr:hypothetical protein [Acidobacteriota bacterium]